LCSFLVIVLTAVTATASVDTPSDAGKDAGTKAKASKRVVVATVTNVDSAFGENEFGDRLIISQVTLRVDETMKGPKEASIVVEIEGGTVGDLTLSVSDMPVMTKGERAVLFLDDSPKGGHKPHGRGAGVWKLDSDERVAGTSVSLADIRAAVKAAESEGQ
jgi:hypothetical protein